MCRQIAKNAASKQPIKLAALRCQRPLDFKRVANILTGYQLLGHSDEAKRKRREACVLSRYAFARVIFSPSTFSASHARKPQPIVFPE